MISAITFTILLLGSSLSSGGNAQETPQNAPPPSPITLHAAIAPDQIEQRVEVLLGLSELPVTEILVDYRHPRAEFIMPPIHKPQKYTLRGYARLKPGKRIAIEGQGVLLSDEYLREAASKPTALAGFLNAWQIVLRDVSRADPDILPTFNIRWDKPGPSSTDEIVAAEKRLGRSLPALYSDAIRHSGPWRVRMPGGFAFELLAPAQAMTAADWIEKYSGPARWEDEEGQQLRRQLTGDLVFAIAGYEPWILRRSGTPCADGQPSLAVGKINAGAFYDDDQNVCGTTAQFETLRELMTEAMSSALQPPDFTVLGRGRALDLGRDRERSTHKVLRFSIAEEMNEPDRPDK